MIVNKILSAIRKSLEEKTSALIVSHVDPDGDSIGSMLALAEILAELGIFTDCYSQDGVPQIYRFLPGADLVIKHIPKDMHYDIVFTVDASDVRRLGDKIKLSKLTNFIVNIDHHPDNTNYGSLNYVRLSSSTAELIYEMCKFYKIKLNRDIAENLYVALVTDTGNFRYENTTAETLLMAADLLKTGLNTHELTTKIYDNKSIAGIQILAAALATLETSPDGKIAWACVTNEMVNRTRAKTEDMVGLVDQLRSIKGVEVAILFREEDDKIKINFRSKSSINVSKIAKTFGGGGHTKAAGAVLYEPIEEAKKQVVTEALKYLKAAQYLI